MIADNIILEYYKLGYEDFQANKENIPEEPILRTAYKHGGIDAGYGQAPGYREDPDIINEIRASHADMIKRKINAPKK